MAFPSPPRPSNKTTTNAKKSQQPKKSTLRALLEGNSDNDSDQDTTCKVQPLQVPDSYLPKSSVTDPTTSTAPDTSSLTPVVVPSPISITAEVSQLSINPKKSTITRAACKVHSKAKTTAPRKSLTVAEILSQRRGQVPPSKCKYKPRASKAPKGRGKKKTKSPVKKPTTQSLPVHIDLNGISPTAWEPISASSPVAPDNPPQSPLDASLNAQDEEVVWSYITAHSSSPVPEPSVTVEVHNTDLDNSTSMDSPAAATISETHTLPNTAPSASTVVSALAPELPTSFDLPGAGFVPLFNLFPNATLDRAILYGEKLNYTFPVSEGQSIFGLLAHFVVLERNPLILGIICSPEFEDPANQAVAITINDIPFKAKSIPLPQLRDILYNHIPNVCLPTT